MWCKECQRDFPKQRGKICAGCRVTATRRRNRQRVVEYKGGKCESCGYSRCQQALDFHHRDPATKEFGLSMNGVTHSLDRLKAEADKCALLCANCHREVHAGVLIL